MKTPKSFGGYFGVLNVSMVIIVLLYVGLGFLGFWRYEEGSADSITLNVPKENIAAKIIKILYSLAIFNSHGLQGYVPIQIMWDTYIVKHLETSNHQLLWEYVLRVVAVIISFLLATTIPLLALFIALFGSFCLSALDIAFPAIMEICINYSDKLSGLNLTKNICLIIFGVVGLLAGSYSCLSEIIIELSKGS